MLGDDLTNHNRCLLFIIYLLASLAAAASSISTVILHSHLAARCGRPPLPVFLALAWERNGKKKRINHVGCCSGRLNPFGLSRAWLRFQAARSLREELERTVMLSRSEPSSCKCMSPCMTASCIFVFFVFAHPSSSSSSLFHPYIAFPSLPSKVNSASWEECVFAFFLLTSAKTVHLARRLHFSFKINLQKLQTVAFFKTPGPDLTPGKNANKQHVAKGEPFFPLAHLRVHHAPSATSVHKP